VALAKVPPLELAVPFHATVVARLPRPCTVTPVFALRTTTFSA